MWPKKEKTFFPIIVLYANASNLNWIGSPDDVIMGKEFQVVATNASNEMFQVAQKCFALGMHKDIGDTLTQLESTIAKGRPSPVATLEECLDEIESKPEEPNMLNRIPVIKPPSLVAKGPSNET